MSKIEDLTPERFRCGDSLTCPSVHRLADGRLLIVGGCAHDLAGQDDDALNRAYGALIAADSIGEQETAIVIDEALLDTLKAEWIAEALSQSTKS